MIPSACRYTNRHTCPHTNRIHPRPSSRCLLAPGGPFSLLLALYLRIAGLARLPRQLSIRAFWLRTLAHLADRTAHFACSVIINYTAHRPASPTDSVDSHRHHRTAAAAHSALCAHPPLRTSFPTTSGIQTSAGPGYRGPRPVNCAAANPVHRTRWLQESLPAATLKG